MEKRTELGKKKKQAYVEKYIKEELKAFHFRLSKKKDADIIEFIDSLENKSQYMKDLIRADMNKGK